MKFEGVFFDVEQFNRLCPFFILVDENLRIEAYGKSIEKLAPGLRNSPYQELFRFKRPFLENEDNKNIMSLFNQLIVIELVGKKIMLRGQLELINGGKFMFIGSPWFESMEQVKENKLNLHDFAFHDPLIDLLHVLKTQEITNSELKELLITINQQKNDLKVAREEAMKLARTKESFLANMSHEIRTPLNGIIGMVRELDKTNLSSKQKLFVNNAGTASKHLLSIINNILDLSKIKAGAFDLEIKSFDLYQLLDEVERIMKPSASEKAIDLSFNLSDEMAHNLLGDASRIRQVLINIISNSIKFTEKGSIQLVCKLLERNEYQQKICISINDTGIGMDDGFLKTIFNKFTQENDTIQRRYGGTGLGMAITYELIQLMEGEIKVSSVKGKGSHFDIILTFDIDVEMNHVDTEPVDYKKMLGGKRVLLVEDNEMNRLIAINLLGHYDIHTEEVIHGKEALEKLQTESFDLILMDLQMPVMDGIEATRMIRSQNITIPIIALTANAFKSEVDKCLEAGMNDFVSKPFDEEVLLKILVKNLSKTPLLQSEKKLALENEQPKLYDLAHIVELSKGNSSFVKRITEIFCEQATIATHDLAISLENGDIKSLNRIAHKLKPSVSEMGITSIKEEILYLESVTELNSRTELISEKVNKVIHILRKLIIQLKG